MKVLKVLGAIVLLIIPGGTAALVLYGLWRNRERIWATIKRQ